MKLSLMTMGLFQWRDAREIVALVASYILTTVADWKGTKQSDSKKIEPIWAPDKQA